MQYLLLIIGFAFLIKGADAFVDGAVSVAYKFHISTTIVGLTIVALGTSLPEAAVSISASLAGKNALAISNVVGSNIFNTLVVVGTSALIAPFVINREVIRRDLPVNIACTAVLLFMIWKLSLNQIDGLILLICLAAYIGLLIWNVKKNPVQETEEEERKILPNWKTALFIVLGAAAIIFGGNITVNAASAIAQSLGMSETLVGLTVVSVGTSLPELITSVVAARKGESGLSIGNAIGSNIMNILFILGSSSFIRPLNANLENVADAALLGVIAVSMYLLSRISPRLGRFKGLLMIGAYCVYLVYIIVR
ncbi:MAG: calcium/sodium antiporter [Erysipelotrichaceae bacterium]|nr:calcium/sodium antiporter [Erysipelotrichaceae bacterium]